MLYLLQELFINNWKVLRIFKSIMLRASVAFMIAFLFMLVFGKPFIVWLKKKKYGDTAREEGPKSHFDKSGTPTMGGLLIIGAILFATAIAGNFTNKFVVFLFVIIGSSNAVNLTDGLDGLVSGPIIVVSITLLIITYLTGHHNYARYLNLYHIPEVSEITVYLASIIGALIGFLWYNFYPAQMFMGDTGSLTLGGILGIIVIFIKQELLLPIAGFVFIMEALSVMIQVWHFKTFGKRVFKMAPIHHHFELLGLPETKVTIRFWIVSIMTCLLTFVILKLR